MAKKFLRRNWSRHFKLGKGQKKNQVWRRPKGRDNKMREKRKGYPAIVSIGCGTDKKTRGTIKEKKPVTIYNTKELENVKKEAIIIVGSVGKKKKIEIAKKAKEMNIQVYNINPGKFLKKSEKKDKENKNKSEKHKEKK